MPYLSVNAISDAIDHIATTYPALAQIIALPESSVEGRQIRALKIARAGDSNRTGVLFLGGTHARELVNPETVLSLALRLCDAYTNNTGLTFGPKTFQPSAIQTVVNGLDIFMLPLVNPDGRHFCLMPGGDPWWRKNRSNHPGLACRGVDLNRNCDFLWSSGIGTSNNACTDIFKGPGAFSEPETRNVRWMIETFTNLACMIDIHSYSELVLYPWGDDDNQTSNSNQNFQNPAFDGLRGIVGSGYKEYIPSGDLHDHVVMAERVRDGIAAVRGRVYTAQQSIALYPTTGTTHDYAYARHFVDTGRRRILGFTLETAREFQPADAEKNNVITEVSAGLMECLLETLCPADAVQAFIDALFPLRAMRSFRDRYMLKPAAGTRYEKMFRAHSLELTGLALDNKAVRDAGTELLRIAGRFFTAKDQVLPRKIANEDLVETDKALAVVRKHASQKLKAAIDAALADLKRLQGKPLTAAFKALDVLEAGAKTKKTRSAVSVRAKRATKPPKKAVKKAVKKRRRS
jgi:murein tripeptide amidase MpaA